MLLMILFDVVVLCFFVKFRLFCNSMDLMSSGKIHRQDTHLRKVLQPVVGTQRISMEDIIIQEVGQDQTEVPRRMNGFHIMLISRLLHIFNKILTQCLQVTQLTCLVKFLSLFFIFLIFF